MLRSNATVAWFLQAPLLLTAPAGFASADERAEMVEWFGGQVHQIHSLDPDADRADLECLRAMVADARIVGLGEATHGTGDFFKIKHRIVRFLVEEMGFTHFAIETSFAKALELGDYVASGTGESTSALASLGAWTWNTSH